MAAQTLTRGRLRRLADVHPDTGRVLSVFMNLDPSELPTPAARSSAVTSILTEAARRVDDVGELPPRERRALRRDLESRLHPYLRERQAGRVSCDIEHATVDQVRASAGAQIQAHAKAAEREALDRLAAGVGSGGRGVAGLADVLEALNEARVGTLLLARGMAASGFCDPETGLLYATAELVPRGATDAPVADVVEKAIEKAIEQSAEVIGIRYHDDLGPLGGIGAVLRY